MRKKRLICLVISIIMMLSVFPMSVSAAAADDSLAEIGCDPIWFEIQDLLDEAYGYVDAVDEYTYESRMMLKTVVDSVDVLSGDDSDIARLQNAIAALVPLSSECNTSTEYVTESNFGSEHPYQNDTAKTWIIEDEDAVYIELSFSEDTYVEEGWDYIYIYDENDNLVGEYTGDQLAGEQLFIPGNCVRVMLVTDYSGAEFGFECFWTYGNSFGDEIEETDPSEETETSEATIKINDTTYSAEVGDVVVYTVRLYAAEIFEDIQAIIHYDSDALEIIPDSSEYPALPNFEGNPILNIADKDCIKFNHSQLSGIDFREEKVLITLKFIVKEAVESEIDLQMEYMTIKGGERQYFYRGVPEYTQGIEFTESLKQAPGIGNEAAIKINDTIYNAVVGDVVSYKVELYAEEIFEDIQAIIHYDSDALEVMPDSSDYPALPNFDGNPIINTADRDCVKFNHSLLSGMDFREEKVLITLRFIVKEAVESEIDLQMEYMTVKGGELQYFYRGVPEYTQGIEFTESLESLQQVLGDTTVNGVVNVKDATAIQKHLSGLTVLNEIFLRLADADGSGIVNIRDVTAIQKFTAGLITETEIGEPVNRTELEIIEPTTETEQPTTETEPPTTETEPTTTETVPVELPVIEYVTDDYFESDHDYRPNTDITWIVESDNVEFIVLYFSEDTYVEDGWDYICIYDEYDNLVGEYTSNELAGATIYVEGSVAKVELISDHSYECYGLLCYWYFVDDDYDDEIVYSETVYVEDSYFESEHDYRPYTDIIWIVEDESADYIELYFSEDTYVEDGWDYICIYDEYDNLVGEYTGAELADVTVIVDGNTAKVQLVSDYSVEYYGFYCEYVCHSYAPYILRGELTDWHEGTAFTSNGDGTYSLTLDLEPGTYEFKLFDTESAIWYGNAGIIENECVNWPFRTFWEYGGENGTLEASGGRYTFTVFTDANSTLRLSIEAEPTPEPALITVYFVKPDDWNDVYLYGFYCDEDFYEITSWTGEYPGNEMTYFTTNGYGQDVYEIVIPEDITYIKFCDGYTEDNYRTMNIPNEYIIANRCYYLTDKAGEYKWNVDYIDVVCGNELD